MFIDLAIIIVNWNLKQDTCECIDSLINAGASLNQIITVDNGSTDDSITTLRNIYGCSLYIIEAEQNQGYAAGANLGIRYALGQRYKWILLLNNDTTVAKDFISNMHQAALSNQGFAIISPIILYHNKPSIIWYLGNHLINKTLLTTSKYKNHKLEENLPPWIQIDFTNGCAMMISRAIFEQIGYLDEGLFMYGEEVDFCWRAKLTGFKFACFTAARIWHKVSKSSQSDKPFARYLQIRNQIIFYQRYSYNFQRYFYYIFTLLRTLIICITDLLMLHTTLISPTWQGWRDGWYKQQHPIGDY